MANDQYHVRWMIRRDMPEVLDIERQSFFYPHDEEQLLCFLRQRNAIGLVAEHKDRVVGLVFYRLHKTRLELWNFAVSPDMLRQGVGTAMINRLKTKIDAHPHRNKLTVLVGEWNLDAQLFFKSQGFECVAIRHEPYDECDSDGYEFEYHASKVAAV